MHLSRILDHIDHVCQLVGNARHVGIGSDLDGRFGAEQCPADLDDIEKLPWLESLLTGKGYTQEETEGILANNWIRFLDRTWSLIEAIGNRDDIPVIGYRINQSKH